MQITGESYVFANVARQALNYVVFVAAFAFAECLLLIRQMDYTESQSVPRPRDARPVLTGARR